MLSMSCLAQKQDRIWIFGDHGGIDFRDTSNVTSFYSGLNGTQVKSSVVSIADKQGNLLFYAAADQLRLQGTRVFNRNDAIMQNGDSLQGHPVFAQGLIILPFPDDTSHFYIFQKTQNSSKTVFYYSIVDMNADGGLGGVISKNNLIQTDSLTDRTTAVKHANGRDWWLIVQRWDQDEYLKYLITPDGIQGPFRQQTANPKPKEEYYGTSRFSRSGNRLVSVGQYGNINLMDFDRCTGDISNYQRIGENIFSNENGYFGCEFSPDEKVLYVGNIYPGPGKYIYQYDLTAPDIKASKQVINMYPDTGLLRYVQMGHILLGPDDKIYVCKGNGSGPNSITVYTQNIDVILNPNVIGTGCNYSSNYFYLNGGRTTYGLPNMVNYNLGAMVGSICDSLNTGIKEQNRRNQFVISPNPLSNWINIYKQDELIYEKNIDVSIFKSKGQILFGKSLHKNENSIQADFLKPGVYVLQIKTSKGVYSERFVKI
ncbi:MAG: T9SS C-terminal target domain-containing protein [Bacteroidetes bacterium]|nr:MAG: T9SS C-terminal target domain-containing protein [Bacteroidota bacterium]REK34471.1 MAG: T9SS C-terminal target domain-containing protein [Bacteroidota bacterium]REK50411.1 MAG: T9SS C-terminal target domain-containing protein [Bacteroidota bacterium]